MSELDADLIARRLIEIKKLLAEINSIAGLDRVTFLSDPCIKDATKYRLLIAIEAAISVCSHIISRIIKEVPKSYSDCFALLGMHEVISKDLAENLTKMAKFRNMLIHIYWKIDDERVYEIAMDHVQDLERFIQEVKKYVERKA